ncbi:MAG: DoxX family protein [Acidobacteria bacterium]|nr:DoxX family protein [Acidobacteriota bacterium]
MIDATALSISKPRLWTGRVLKTLPVLFLLMDGTMKLFKPPFVVQATLQLGYPESTIVGIGVTLLISTALFVIPRTTVLGAILLTGYLGGAVASNVRAGTPVFNVVFPILLAVLVWSSSALCDRRLEVTLFRANS